MAVVATHTLLRSTTGDVFGAIPNNGALTNTASAACLSQGVLTTSATGGTYTQLTVPATASILTITAPASNAVNILLSATSGTVGSGNTGVNLGTIGGGFPNGFVELPVLGGTTLIYLASSTSTAVALNYRFD